MARRSGSLGGGRVIRSGWLTWALFLHTRKDRSQFEGFVTSLAHMRQLFLDPSSKESSGHLWNVLELYFFEDMPGRRVV